MPSTATALWHTMIGTYCSWLPGDERGFRSRDHRIHSSGDYKNPPPPHEHEGLRDYHRERHPNAVIIPSGWRLIVANIIATTLRELGFDVLVVSVTDMHAHILAQMPVDLPQFNQVLGKCKNKSSRAIKKVCPGQVWSRGDTHIMVRNDEHRLNAYTYVRDRQGKRVAVWCVLEGEYTREAMVE